MATEFKLPLLAEGIDSADVAELHVAVGETVEAGQILMELETDKAVMELPSPNAGTITSILVKKGDTVKVGQAILLIDAVGAATNGESAKPAADAKPAAEIKAVPEPVAARAGAAPPSPSTSWSNGNT
ncbi:MAG: biotin/lipoyl-containing protein, partial [Planctomycetaceae bacterium]|nr:biotin/lipoyl-containing protein [Planctomycetaceae bacterium]